MKIAVIGGGTTAVLVLQALHSKFKSAKITQFADGGKTIGVGEATIPETTAYMDSIGLTSIKLIRECGASFKTGVKFENWADENKEIWFPFGDTGASFRNIRKNRLSTDILDYLDGLEHGNVKTYPIGMHFNTSKLHNLKFRNISKVLEFITDERRNELVNEFDIICDCSGFNAVFKPESSEDSVLKQLSNNQAHVIWIPHMADRYTDSSTFKSYSTFRAAEQGWIWHIPTQETLGIGYVHNSDDSITAEFTEYLKDRFGVIEPQYKIINFKNHASTNPYRQIGNCKVLNFGLSSCFIEPIQSTGLYLTALGISLGMQVIAGEKSMQNANFELLKEFEGVSAFVAANLKYCKRNTRYWNKFKSIELDDARIASSSVFTKEETEQLYKSLKAGHTILDDISNLSTSGSVDFKKVINLVIQ